MSQNEHAAQKSQIEKRLKFFQTALLLLIGIVVVASSVLFGKEWDWGELIYDLGMAVVIAGLVEVFVMRILSSLKPGWIDLLDDTDILIKELQDYSKEMEEKTIAFTIKRIDRTVENIEDRFTRLEKELDTIRLAVDTEYREQKAIVAALDKAHDETKE